MPEIVGVVDVFAVGERELYFGDGGFEREDALRALRQGGRVPASRNIVVMCARYFARTCFMCALESR